MTVNVSVQIFCLRISNRLVQFYQAGILSCHIDHNICRDSLWLVCQPFNRACIHQWSDTNRFFLIINLGVQITDFKLGYHINHAAHFSVSKNCCTVFIQQWNLTEIHRLDIFWKIAFFDCKKIPIFFCIYNRWGQNASCCKNNHQCHQQDSSNSEHFAVFCFLKAGKPHLYPISCQ